MPNVFCKHCGQSIDSDSTFCRYCGKSQSTSSSQVSQEERWEVCEIQWVIYTKGKRMWDADKFQFKAVRAGASGTETVARSVGFEAWRDAKDSQFETRDYTTIPPKENAEGLKALNELVARLVQDGWESQGHYGTAWFQYKFRRLIKG